MQNELKASAQKVKDFLDSQGFAFDVKELPDSTRTADDAAKAIGCTVAQIAKSLIFKDEQSDELVLVIASGVNRVDTAKVEAATGYRLAQADGKSVKKRTGFAIGGVPPVAHKHPVITLIDESLHQFDTIWAAAGTPNAVFSLSPIDLDKLTQGSWLTIA